MKRLLIIADRSVYEPNGTRLAFRARHTFKFVTREESFLERIVEFIVTTFKVSY